MLDTQTEKQTELSLPNKLFKFLGLGNQETITTVLTTGKGNTVRTGGRKIL